MGGGNPIKRVKKQVKRSTKQVSKQTSRAASQVKAEASRAAASAAAEAKRAKESAAAEAKRAADRVEKEARRIEEQIENQSKRVARQTGLTSANDSSSGPNSLSTITLDGGDTGEEEKGTEKGLKKSKGTKRRVGKKGTKINKVPLKAAGGIQL